MQHKNNKQHTKQYWPNNWVGGILWDAMQASATKDSQIRTDVSKYEVSEKCVIQWLMYDSLHT